MRFKIAGTMCFIFTTAVSLAAQTKVVTNADLEKYKQERLKADREYRENYARLGLPSPEELDRRREQSRIETAQLSAKLLAERLDRERLEAEREAAARLAAAYFAYSRATPEPRNIEQTYFWSYGRPYRHPARHIYYQQPGYFAGGQFWPTGSRTKPQPLIRVRRR